MIQTRNLQAWPMAILLDKEAIHTLAQPDSLFVALPLQIENHRPVVVEFDTDWEK
jgi:hypothetical protein